MKKMWKMKKDAVSPVIATILMVAITVVLAAVLYVMVMGFGTTGTQTPTGAFTGSPTNQTSGYRLQLGVVSPETNWNDCKLSLLVAGSTTSLSPVAITMGVGTGSVTISMGTGGAKTYTITITDLAADGKISNGDSVMVKATGGFAATTAYSLSLVFNPSGGQICSQGWTTP